RSKLVPVGGLVWSELDAFSKIPRCLGPLRFVEGARTANLVCHRALQHRIELHHERIRWTDLPRAAQFEVGLSPFKIARAPIRHGERVMNQRRVLVDGESLFQIIDGATVVLPGERSEERRVGKECRSRWS